MPFWTLIYVWAFWVLLGAGSCLALFIGGKAERWAAVAYISAAIAEVMLRSPYRTRFFGVEPVVMAVDVCLMIALICLALRYERRWLIIASAIQIISALAHPTRALVPISPLAYEILSGAAGNLQVLLLISGAGSHALRCSRSRRRARSAVDITAASECPRFASSTTIAASHGRKS